MHLLLLLLAAGAPGAAAGPSSSSSEPAHHDACQAAPRGMVCIPGGPAVIGSDDHGEEERPRHLVEVSTFYLDRHEVTAGEYRACERAKACPKLPRPGYYRAFQAADLPAVPITWEMAHHYCVWAGKRLPSEAEWEKAARGGEKGTLYPWGDEEPTCDRAHYAPCEPRITKKVGSYPAGHYGVRDLAGNGYEWVKDWASDCYEEPACKDACGPACLGKDPWGPCDGADRCKGHYRRVLKGGSWYWPKDTIRGSWRRGEKPKSGLHRLSFRCASSTPTLTAWKPAYMVERRAALGPPEPPSEEELQAFRDVVEDTDIFQIPECERVGKATTRCRDPMSYLTSNEALQYVFASAITDVGGGYVGIGADQSYSFIAEAKSRWAWIFDYDPQVVRVHQIVRAVILDAPDRRAFQNAFTQKHKDETEKRIRAALAGQPDDEIEATVKLYQRNRTKLWSHYVRQAKPKRWVKGFGWLQTEANYAYIRTLYQQGRIQALKGNMLTDVAMPSIARSARALKVPVRVYYTSNAEEQWRDLPEPYRRNVAGLPFDDESLVLRTLYTRRYHEASSKWHYVIQGGRHLQERILRTGYANVWRFMEDRHQVGAFPKKPEAEKREAEEPDDNAASAASSDEDEAEPSPKRRLDFLSHIGVPSVTEHEPAASAEGAGATPVAGATGGG